MTSIRSQLPYASLLDTDNGSPQLKKVQALVSADDKRTVLSALGGDDGILTFLIQHSFQRTASFIRQNKLNVYDSANHSRILDFIRNGSDPRPSGDAVVVDDSRAVTGNKHPSTPARSVSTTARKSRARGSKAKETSQNESA
jgi:hypothetical protein